MTNERLRDMVGPFGQVLDCSVIMDKMTGQSRGFGFVQLANPEQANNAIQVRPSRPLSVPHTPSRLGNASSVSSLVSDTVATALH
jgi:RNA recognition motif-containing protein